MKQTGLFLLLLLFPLGSVAQGGINWVTDVPRLYSFVHKEQNVVIGDTLLYPLWRKLQYLKTQNKGTIRIVHIGDSHLQADLITTELRNGFRDFFGNAGRGLVFPYQLARSNAPSDVSSSSNVSWQYNRLAHPHLEKGIPCGIAGFGIHSSSASAVIHLHLRAVNGETETFDLLRFFMEPNDNHYGLSFPGTEETQVIQNSSGPDSTFVCADAVGEQTGFSVSAMPGNADWNFYGVSLEKMNTPGVIYHTIGVNGGQYSHFTATPLFWQQLPALNADCYILSMGTNEAQRPSLAADVFLAEVDAFVTKLRAVSPYAVIIITSPAGSYYRMKRPNRVVATISKALPGYCNDNHIAFWDLFNISGGIIGTAGWRKNHLLGKDLVHYTKQGYQLQGMLFLNALSDSYNNFITR